MAMLTFNFSPFPDIVTERCRLRKPDLADAAELHRMRSNPDIMRYIDRPLSTGVPDMTELIGKMRTGIETNDNISWAIDINGQYAGSVGYWRITPEDHYAEIGYMLDIAHWGRGIMSEIIPHVLDYGFGVMNLHRIEANINADNAASRAVLLKYGFQTDGVFRENYHYNGRFLDSTILSLLTHEWQIRTPA